MLDYLKKVSNILILLVLLTSISHAKLNEKPTCPPLLDSHLQFVLKQVGDYVVNHEWDFETLTFEIELTELEHLLTEKNGIKYEDGYIMITKYLATFGEDISFYIIRVSVFFTVT